ncbi:nucleotidyl transferase AbiEii/AbiGii toxin family protein [Nostocoides australiense]
MFRRLQSAARSAAAKAGTGAPTQEYLIRHTLESFLDRLTRTAHAEGFVLKGGILLAAYGVRRPTRDADANAVGADVTADHLVAAAHDIAAVETDGVVFDLDRSACRRSASTPTTPDSGCGSACRSGRGKAPPHGMSPPETRSFPRPVRFASTASSATRSLSRRSSSA